MSDASTAKENNTILLVEDSKTNRMVLTHLLHKMGFDVLECDNGDIALNILKDEEKSKNVICVVSDIMMPVMDGLSLLKPVTFKRVHDIMKEIFPKREFPLLINE